MFANKIGCTVYEKTVKNHMESYVPHFLPTVYWEDTVAQVQTRDVHETAGSDLVLHSGGVAV